MSDWTAMKQATLSAFLLTGDSGHFNMGTEAIGPFGDFGGSKRAAITLTSAPLPVVAGDIILDGTACVSVQGMPGAIVDGIGGLAQVVVSNMTGTQVLWATGVIGVVGGSGNATFDLLPLTTYTSIFGTDLTHSGHFIRSTAGGVFVVTATIAARLP